MLRRTNIGRAVAPALLLAAGAARAGELRLEASAAQVALCAGQSAELRVESASPPVLSASAGALSAPRSAGPGRWVADYWPPKECHPQVAVVSAAADGGWGWLALQLVGKGEVLVRTSPRAVISVRIGERVFGPVTADAQGQAVVPVVVPPGVRSAWDGQREIPLQVPSVRRVHVALNGTLLAADRAGEVVVRAFAVRDDGAPGDGAALTLSASEGTLSPSRSVGPGVVETLWRLKPGRAGAAVVTAAIPGDGGGAARAELERPAGAPASAAVVGEALARPGTVTISPRLGVTLHAAGMSPGVSLEVALWPAGLRGRAGLAAEAGWWAFTRTDRMDVAGQPLVLRGQADMVPLLLTALGRMRLGELGTAWLGAGGGAVLVLARQAQGSLAGAPEAGIAPEAHALAGAGWRLGPGVPFLEARVGWQGDAGGSSLRGSLRTCTFSVGYRFETL